MGKHLCFLCTTAIYLNVQVSKIIKKVKLYLIANHRTHQSYPLDFVDITIDQYGHVNDFLIKFSRIYIIISIFLKVCATKSLTNVAVRTGQSPVH